MNLILNWYLENKRELPWRMDKDPYHVWISEIMLQQTRIEAVIAYYERFMKRIPTIKDLSEITEDELLKLWEGLGYYSRARNLKKAALMIMDQFEGVFPNTYESILSLPGIGEYTAGAIASICFDLKEVAIDGNVMRVFCRVNGLDLDVSDLKVKKEIGQEIQSILPARSGDFNQGIMELGEVLCIPGGVPKCALCPLQKQCKAHLDGKESLIPRKIVKKEKIEEVYTVFLIECNGKFALRKRNVGLLKNMWEFPNKEGIYTENDIKKLFSDCTHFEIGVTNAHVFTHKKWFMNSYYIKIKKEISDYTWVTLGEIESHYAIPSAFLPFLEHLKKK